MEGIFTRNQERTLKKAGMENYSAWIKNRSLDEQEALLIKLNVLYDAAEEDSDKIKLLNFIEELEEKIRAEQYKARLMNGEE